MRALQCNVFVLSLPKIVNLLIVNMDLNQCVMHAILLNEKPCHKRLLTRRSACDLRGKLRP